MDDSSAAGEGAVRVWMFFAAAVFLAYAPVLWGEYACDGKMLIERAAAERARPLLDVFLPSRYSSGTAIMSWRPLTAASFIVFDVQLFALNAALSHTLDLLVHATNATLLFFVATAAFSRAGEMRAEAWACGAAMLFALHPLASEVAACSGFRFDSMALMFALGAVLALGDAPEEPRRIAAACGLFLLALGSKEIGIVALPLALAIHRRAGLKAGAAMLACLAAFGMAWRLFRYESFPTGFFGGGGRALGMGNFLASFAEVYARLFFWPDWLRVDHGFEPAASLHDPRIALGAAVSAMALGVPLLLARFSAPALLGACWVAAGFFPVSQVVPVPDPVAERFCYVPLAGACLLAAEVLRRCVPGRVAVAIFAVALAACCVRTQARARDWADDTTLNIANWTGDPRPRAMLSLGALHLDAAGAAAPDATAERGGHMARAKKFLDEFAAARPDDAEGQRLLGVWHLAAGNRAEAEAHAARAMELAPGSAEALRLGKALGLSAPTSPQ